MAHNYIHGFSDIQEGDNVKNCCNDLQIQNQNSVGNGIVTGSQKSMKRNNYLSWDEYFMAIAFLSAQRSKDPKTQVGACIVNEEKKIVGIGYNGMPIGCSDDIMPWGRNPDNKLEDKHLYVCHAELNAVLNKNSADVKRCCIYVALFPCNECAKVIIQSGIKEVVYYSYKHANKDEFKVSKRLLTEAKIILRKYQPVNEKILIDFSVIDEEAKASDIDRVTEDLATL